MERVAAEPSETVALLAALLLSRPIEEASSLPIFAKISTVCPAERTHPLKQSLPAKGFKRSAKWPRMPLQPPRSAVALHSLGGRTFVSTRHLLALRPASNNIAPCAQAPTAVCDLLRGCTTHLINLSCDPCTHGGKQFY